MTWYITIQEWVPGFIAGIVVGAIIASVTCYVIGVWG